MVNKKTFIFFITVCILILNPTVFAQMVPINEVQQAVKQAEISQDKGDYWESVRSYSKAIALDPGASCIV